MTDEVTIGQLDPVVNLLPAALLEIEQTTTSFSVTMQQIIDLAAGGAGVTSINADITPAQILAGTAGRISLVDAGATHTFDIDSAYVGQATITTLGTIASGIWEGTVVASAFLDADTMHLSVAQTVTGAKTFQDNLLILRNPANTFSMTIGNAAIGSNLTLDMPVITVADTILARILAATIQNKTLDSTNTIQAGAYGASSIVDADTATFTTTKISTLNKALLNTAIIYNDQNNSLGAFYLDIDDIVVPANPAVGVRRLFVDNASGELSVRTNAGATISLEAAASADMLLAAVQTVTGAKTFENNTLVLRNPANTFSLTIVNPPIGSALNLTIPTITVSDTVVVLTLAQTLANKTLTTPTIASFVNAGHNHQAAAGGAQLTATLALDATGTKDSTTFLRGDDVWALPPGSGPPFDDATVIIKGSIDPTKFLRFEVDGLSTATTRVISPPDADITLVNTSDGLIADANTATFTTTKISTLSKTLLNTAIVYTDQANIFGNFDQTFKDSRLRIENPAGTFEIGFQTSGEIADRVLTIPLLGGNRSFVVTGLTSQITLGTEVDGALANLSDVTAKTGTGTIVVMDTSPTIVTPTIASFVNATHDHQAAAGGGTLLSTSALSDTADIAYLNTDNTFLTNTKQTFTHQASKAGIALAAVAGDVSAPNNGEFWYNLTSDKFRVRENGATVDMISGEANTSSNDGTGEGLAKTKVGVDLPFKSLVAEGITLSSDTNEVKSRTQGLVMLGTLTLGADGAAMDLTVTFPTGFVFADFAKFYIIFDFSKKTVTSTTLLLTWNGIAGTGYQWAIIKNAAGTITGSSAGAAAAATIADSAIINSNKHYIVEIELLPKHAALVGNEGMTFKQTGIVSETTPQTNEESKGLNGTAITDLTAVKIVFGDATDFEINSTAYISGQLKAI